MNRSLFVIVVSALLYSCASTGTLPKYQLGNSYYRFRQSGGRFTKVYVKVVEDSVKIIPVDTTLANIKPATDQLFVKPSLDIDVMVTLFKYRPSTQNLPRQLTTDFSGNLYFGYRLDRFKVHFIKTPGGLTKKVRHNAVSIGAFGGLGSTAVTPWTTNQGTMDEYNGLVLCRGFALMFGVNNLTVGLGVGRDYLTDRDKDIWIYQNKGWYGLTLSLNLN